MAPTSIGRRYFLNPVWVLPVSGLLLLLQAADPAWKTKPPAEWTPDDANQVLTNSPWSKIVTAGITRKQSEDERRAGGEMGDAKGIGYDGIEKTPKPQFPTNVGDLVRPNPYKAPPPQFMKLRLRWESAMPVHLAELKAGVIEPPTLQDEGYSIAVYGIPATFPKGDPKSLGEPLKSQAFLKRDGKKDAKPSSVEVFERDSGVVVVYEFPPSVEISKKDGNVQFEAQIGRLVITSTFNIDEMQFQGKPAL